MRHEPELASLISRKGSLLFDEDGGTLGLRPEQISGARTRWYLTHSLPREDIECSGIRLLGCESIVEENAEFSPGAFLGRFGYLVIGSSVGGDAICLSPEGTVVWASHSSFSEDSVLFFDNVEEEWNELQGLTSENVRRSVVQIDESPESFLRALLLDQLEDVLDSFDSKY